MGRHAQRSLLLLLILNAGCRASVCEDASVLCGAAAPASIGGAYAGAPQAFAACLVAAGTCSVAAAARCAEVPTDPLAASGSPGVIELKVQSYQIESVEGQNSLRAEIQLSNISAPSPLPIADSLISVEDTNKGLHAARHFGCDGGASAIGLGGTAQCNVSVEYSKSVQAVRLVYHGLPGFVASDALTSDGTPVTGPEDSDALCSDGLDNDGDGFADCDDYDCIQSPQVYVCDDSGLGDEDTDTLCSDGRDNDNDGFVDCEDYDCSRNPAITVCEGGPGGESEDTDALCSDGLDNDGNGYTDCDDYSCSRNTDVFVCDESEDACLVCFQDAVDGRCASAAETCSADDRCFGLFQCAFACALASGPECQAACLARFPDARSLYDPLAACLNQECAGVCAG